MAQNRDVDHLNFSGSGIQTVAVGADEFINIFQVDISIAVDTIVTIKIGTKIIFTGSLSASSAPIQLFFYDFGNGRGSGEKGDDLTVELGESGDVFVARIIESD